MKETKDFIKREVSQLNINIIPMFYNEVKLEVDNNPDDCIYNMSDLDYNIKNNIFSDVVTDNIVRNILMGNANSILMYIYIYKVCIIVIL